MQRGLRLVNRTGNVRAAARDDGGVERRERFVERVVVERDGALQKGVAGERDQTNAVAVHFARKIIHRELGPGETVGLHVRRQHAAGSIHGKDDLDAAPGHLLPTVTGLGPRERDEETADGGEE